MSVPARLAADAGLDGLTQDSDVSAFERFLENWARSLDGVSPLERELSRRIVETRLNDLGVKAVARLVASALATYGSEAATPEAEATGISFAPRPPWPDPVDGATLLLELTEAFTDRVVLPEGAATALALWTIHAHAHDAARVSPLLILTSPEKQCGKTTLLTVLRSLVPRPLPAANITPAVLFRAVEKYRPTLLVDEADTFLGEREELRGILNAGHAREFASVLRAVGDDFEPRSFCVWAPKALAAIGQLPDTLTDRAIVIPLRRKTATETTIEVSETDVGAVLAPLARQAQRWAADHLEALRAARPRTEGLANRARDNWRPLLAIADAAGEPWPERARRAARLFVGRLEDQSAGVLLLGDLRTLFARHGAERLETATLVEDLTAMIERPWPEWKQGRPLTPRQLARLLERFGIRPRVVRIGERTPRGYELGDFQDAFSRYLPPDTPLQSATAQQANNDGAFPDSLSATRPIHVADTKPQKSPPTLGCCVVADMRGVSGALPLGDGLERLPGRGDAWEPEAAA